MHEATNMIPALRFNKNIDKKYLQLMYYRKTQTIATKYTKYIYPIRWFFLFLTKRVTLFAIQILIQSGRMDLSRNINLE